MLMNNVLLELKLFESHLQMYVEDDQKEMVLRKVQLTVCDIRLYEEHLDDW